MVSFLTIDTVLLMIFHLLHCGMCQVWERKGYRPAESAHPTSSKLMGFKIMLTDYKEYCNKWVEHFEATNAQNRKAYLCGKVYSNGATTYKEYIVQCYCPTSYKEPTEEEKGKCMLEALKKMDTHQRERFTRPRSCIAKEIAVLESKLRTRQPQQLLRLLLLLLQQHQLLKRASPPLHRMPLPRYLSNQGMLMKSAVEIPLYTKKKNFQNQWKQILERAKLKLLVVSSIMTLGLLVQLILIKLLRRMLRKRFENELLVRAGDTMVGEFQGEGSKSKDTKKAELDKQRARRGQMNEQVISEDGGESSDSKDPNLVISSEDAGDLYNFFDRKSKEALSLESKSTDSQDGPAKRKGFLKSKSLDSKETVENKKSEGAGTKSGDSRDK
uniref:Uncharacterized protein n=1 Tax=Haemonchus contortus TaxID=6289 RepID=A0A7I4XSU9_HAECO